jgi:hypothetical protein
LWAIEKFIFLLQGRKFVLETDHKSIEVLKKKVDFGSRKMYRWFERFKEFDFDVRYIRGEELLEADALSRASEENIDDVVLKIHKGLNHRKRIQQDVKQKE